jgi:hypothetical protein
VLIYDRLLQSAKHLMLDLAAIESARAHARPRGRVCIALTDMSTIKPYEVGSR